MSSANETQRVLVVGAGIGGLATALELHRVGIRSTIIEAVPQFGPVGVGINILPHAAKRLCELGLDDALTQRCVLTKESAFFNRFGQLVYREPAGRDAGYDYPQYSIHRAHLHEVLLNAVIDRLGPDCIQVGRRLAGVSQSADAVTAHVITADRSHADINTDVLVGADGIHSVVRRYLFPDEGPPRYTGVTMWRGTSVWSPFMSGATMVRAGWIATGQLVMYPIVNDVDGNGNQLLNWVVELQTEQRSDREWNRAGRLEDFIEHFADWKFDFMDVPAMLSSATTILEYPMVDQEPLPRWSHGRITLLGDAAHPMIPRGSNGAGQTILDARALADAFRATPADPVAALQAYEAERRPATSDVVRANHTSSPDAILRTVYERTGDRPFARLEDVVDVAELAEIAEGYARIAAYSTEQLRQVKS